MDADQIEERLLFELRSARHDDVFSGASAVDLFLLLRRGAKRMVTEERTGEDDLAVALEQLRLFLTEMDAERVRLEFSEFHEVTVSGAWARLCPGFWPFC